MCEHSMQELCVGNARIIVSDNCVRIMTASDQFFPLNSSTNTSKNIPRSGNLSSVTAHLLALSFPHYNRDQCGTASEYTDEAFF